MKRRNLFWIFLTGYVISIGFLIANPKFMNLVLFGVFSILLFISYAMVERL